MPIQKRNNAVSWLDIKKQSFRIIHHKVSNTHITIYIYVYYNNNNNNNNNNNKCKIKKIRTLNIVCPMNCEL